ncbi:geranylgeranylglycerol-phosphate geranylgeranyltransferase [Segetibacter aerophilus]|nr:geranylgeranylglycerol-phosphate geranylgeranyltransferase [Segetibacter aerophilus]
MRLTPAFLRLVRWPNLLFFALTQILFVYCIIHPIMFAGGAVPNIKGVYCLLLVLSYVLIYAEGYVINDYFDLNIDQINKPDKVVVEKIISRRWVIFWHVILSVFGVALGFYIDWKTDVRFLGLLNMGIVGLLFVYSISLKKKLLVGNILVSVLTAWAILVITFCETSNLLHLDVSGSYTQKITRISFLYTAFAFVISLIREVVKDMEDVDGDRRYGCNTMPIAWGIQSTKVFVSVWLVVLIAMLLVVQFYVLILNWWWSAAYSLVLIIVPLIYIFKLLVSAKTSKDYHHLSTLIKMVMFAGILSMLFFRIYLR